MADAGTPLPRRSLRGIGNGMPGAGRGAAPVSKGQGPAWVPSVFWQSTALAACTGVPAGPARGQDLPVRTYPLEFGTLQERA